MSSRQRWTLVAACVATFMLLIDITVVNVALPEIQRELDASFSDLQWVIDAYALTLAAFLLTAGSAADRVGRRKVFVVGLAVFTVSSLACGLAGTPAGADRLARVSGRRRRGPVRHLAGAAGRGVRGPPARHRVRHLGRHDRRRRGHRPAGGRSAHRRPGLGVDLPGERAGRRSPRSRSRLARVPESSDPDARSIDVPGVITFSTALFCLIFAIVRGNAEGWGSTLIVSLFVAAAVLLDLLRGDRGAGAGSRCSTCRLFRKPAFAGASIVAFGLSASMFSMFLYLTLYLQGVLGADPLEAGLYFLPLSLISFVVAPVAGQPRGPVPRPAVLRRWA